MLTLMSRQDTDPRPSEQHDGFWSSWRTRLAAAVLVLIVLLAIALIVLRPAPEPDAAPAPAPTASTPAPSTLREQGESVCGLEPGDQVVPSVAPVSTDWELVGSVAAPTAPASIGPGLVEDGLRSCYARSPLGALYAATGFLATTSEPRLRLPAVRDLTAKGEGRDTALDLITGSDPGGAGSGLQIAGFTFLNWDPRSAVVDVAMNVEGTAVHLPVSLRWEDGDWKVILPPDGDLYDAIAALPNLTGYVPWSGA